MAFARAMMLFAFVASAQGSLLVKKHFNLAEAARELGKDLLAALEKDTGCKKSGVTGNAPGVSAEISPKADALAMAGTNIADTARCAKLCHEKGRCITLCGQVQNMLCTGEATPETLVVAPQDPTGATATAAAVATNAVREAVKEAVAETQAQAAEVAQNAKATVRKAFQLAGKIATDSAKESAHSAAKSAAEAAAHEGNYITNAVASTAAAAASAAAQARIFAAITPCPPAPAPAPAGPSGPSGPAAPAAPAR